MRILIVDDDPEDAEIIRDYLEASDLENLSIDWVDRAEIAAPKILSGAYDVCLIDQYMGGLSGTGLMKQLQDQGFVGRVVLVSGIAGRDDRMDAMYYGAMDMLNKANLSSVSLANSIRFVMSEEPRALRKSEAS